MKDNHTPGEAKKPQHVTYANDRNILYPEPYNAGLDEMEAYYDPLLTEALEALRELVTEITNWEDDVREVIQIPIEHGMDLGQAKAIYAKNARRVSDELQRTDSNAKRKSEAS